MSTPLTLNTSALQEILTIAQNLPSGGGGEITIKTGQFTVPQTASLTMYAYHFVPIEDCGVTVQHNMGKLPKLVLIVADLNGSIDVGDTTICGYAVNTGTGWEQKGFLSSDSYTPDHLLIFNSTLDAETDKSSLGIYSWGCIASLTADSMFVVPGDPSKGFSAQTYNYVMIG